MVGFTDGEENSSKHKAAEVKQTKKAELKKDSKAAKKNAPPPTKAGRAAIGKSTASDTEAMSCPDDIYDLQRMCRYHFRNFKPHERIREINNVKPDQALNILRTAAIKKGLKKISSTDINNLKETYQDKPGGGVAYLKELASKNDSDSIILCKSRVVVNI